MDNSTSSPVPEGGLGQRVLQEVLRTPPLREAIVLNMRDMNPDTAAGLARTFLWEEAGVSMGLISALPDLLNWLTELLLELGRQFNSFPEALLRDFLSKLGSGLDKEKLSDLSGEYLELIQKLTVEDEGAVDGIIGAAFHALNGAIATADLMTAKLEENSAGVAAAVSRGWRELDTAALGKISGRILRIADRSRRTLQAGARGKLRAFLAELEPGEALRALAGIMKGVLSAGVNALSWAFRARKGR